MSEISEERVAYRWQPRPSTATKVVAALIVASLSLSACGIRKFLAPRAEPTAVQADADETLSRLIVRAKEDLVQSTSAAADEITVVSTEEVEWGDTGLGCPHPDEMYAQMITPGYFIVLKSGGSTFDFHSGTDPEGPLVHCTEDGTPAGPDPALQEEPEGETQMDADSARPRLIERAIADLVQATSAAAAEITVVSTEEVEWGDTSLGCPHPDEMYAQMITPGYLIVLESGGNTYDFHSGTDPEGPLIQCTEDGTPALSGTIEVVTQMDAGVALPRLIERAIEDLVQATSAAADEIAVVSTEEVEWSDTSLGCPQPDEMYAQMITPGYLIVLEGGGNAYEYHSGTDPEGPLVQCADDEPTEDETQSGADVASASDAQAEPLARLIQRAIADLVQTTSAAADEITVVNTEEVEWSDTSLGCPQPDGMYAQMITPGYLFILERDGETYEYHSGTDPEGPLVQCNLETDGEEEPLRIVK